MALAVINKPVLINKPVPVSDLVAAGCSIREPGCCVADFCMHPMMQELQSSDIRERAERG